VVKAVFLDRDGTVNREVSYLSRTKDLQLLPDVAAALRRLQEEGFLLIVISNQSGVARGYFSHRRMKKVNRRLRRMLARENVRLSGMYACPWHEEGRSGPFRRVHSWCKPSPGMLLEAAARFSISLENSWMIGDRESDIRAGAAAGCRTILVRSGYGREAALQCGGWGIRPDYVVEDLAAAGRCILEAEGMHG